MTNKTIPKTDDLVSFSNEEMRSYIHKLQDDLQNKLNTGLSIDDILDNEDPFESLEPILPREVYPILVLAMINDIRTDTVMDAILKGLSFAMIIGVIIGTYSSIFVATPILNYTNVSQKTILKEDIEKN